MGQILNNMADAPVEAIYVCFMGNVVFVARNQARAV